MTATNKPTIPEGYKMNAVGHLVPLSKVKPLDSLRDVAVSDLISKVKEEQRRLLILKNDLRESFDAFVSQSAKKYQVIWGGKKGNISLTSYDGTKKVHLQVSERIGFDERLQIAYQLASECAHDWSSESNDNTKVIVESHFARDSKGNVSTAEVMKMLDYNFTEPRWLKAMDLIRDSITVTGKKEYMRFYERRSTKEKWSAIPLDIAAL